MVNKLTYPAKENAVQEKINEIIDNTADINLSNLSSTGESKFQEPLVSGTNIKTINNTSLLGSGNISLVEDKTDADNTFIIGDSGADTSDNNIIINGYVSGGNNNVAIGCLVSNENNGFFVASPQQGGGWSGGIKLLNLSTGLIPDTRISSNIARTSAIPTQASDISAADTTLSNVSSIDSNSAVQTALDGKVSKSGDTMTGLLNISKDSISESHFINLVNENITKGTNPAQNTYTTISFNDRTNDSSYLNTRMGCVECSVNADGTVGMTLAATKNEAGSNIIASMQVLIDSSGDASCKFPDTTCVDGQYVETNETIVSSLNLNNANSSDTGWYTLSSLPDNGEYLCWIIGRGTTGSTSGNYIYCRVVSDIVTGYMTCCATRTRTASTVTSEGVICIPVKKKRVKIKRDANWDGTGLFILRGYRRLGTNA